MIWGYPHHLGNPKDGSITIKPPGLSPWSPERRHGAGAIPTSAAGRARGFLKRHSGDGKMVAFTMILPCKMKDIAVTVPKKTVKLLNHFM